MPIKKVTAKLGKMRKAQDFTVQKRGEDELLIQSDKSIGLLNVKTCQGKLNTKGHLYPHLSHAEPYTFTEEFVKQCQEAVVPTNADGTISLSSLL